MENVNEKNVNENNDNINEENVNKENVNEKNVDEKMLIKNVDEKNVNIMLIGGARAVSHCRGAAVIRCSGPQGQLFAAGTSNYMFNCQPNA